MSASLFTRRRSERLAQLIDEAGGGRRHHVRSGLDDELAELLSVTRRVSELPLTVEANPEFREGLRSMLMATIEREGIGVTAVRPELDTPPSRAAGLLGSSRVRTRSALVAGVAAGTLALSGMSAASGDAIPGDALYSVKRSTERAQLALAGSDISRGQLFLEFARTRLSEASSVGGNPTGVAGVFDDMDNETREGVRLLTATAVDRRDEAALDAVDAFVSGQKRTTSQLRDSLSGPARQRADASLALLEAVQQRSSALRTVLPCGTAATGSPDQLGPAPTARCKPTGQPANEGVATPSKGPAGAGTGQVGARAGETGTAASTAPNAPSVEIGTSATPQAPVTSDPPAVTTDGSGLLGGVGGVLGDIIE